MRVTQRDLGVGFLALLGLAWLAALVLPYDVVADVHPSVAEAPISAAHWLGTDHLGRDVAQRLFHATGAFVGPGLVCAGVAGVFGGALGAAGGWGGGATEVAVRYVYTVLGAVPRLVLVLLAATIWGGSPWVLALAAGIACAPEPGGAVMARIQALRGAEFVLAARAHGIPGPRLFWYHVLWVNCRGALARQMLQAFGFFLVIETTLSYLGGFGVPEPSPSGGNMLAFEFGYQDGNLWASLAPGLAIWGVASLTAWVGADREARPGN